MIKDILRRPSIKYLLIIFPLFLLGIGLLALRNPDPLRNPVLFCEDGSWPGLGLSYGWSYALLHTRGDYYTMGNVLLLFIAVKLSWLLSGNVFNLLPQTIAIVSYAFYSSMATAAFIVTKKVLPNKLRIVLFLLFLLIPLGKNENQIIGRLPQIGYYMPIITIFLLYIRENGVSLCKRLAIDFGLLLCAATNPMILGLAFVYVCWDFFRNRFTNWVKKNWTIIIPFLILSIFLIPTMANYSRVPYDKSNLIEAAIGRSIVYPFLFPWYHHLHNAEVLVFTVMLIIFIAVAYTLPKDIASKRLLLFSIVTYIIYNTALIITRPMLTTIKVSHYKSFDFALDRYYTGLNALIIFITIISIYQFIRSNKTAFKYVGWIILSSILIIYISHLSAIFEIRQTRFPIRTGLYFSDQLCLAKELPGGKLAKVQVNPEDGLWNLITPIQYIDKSRCSNNSQPKI